MINKVTLIGRLGADPEVRTTNDGTTIANVRLVTTEKFKGRDGQAQERAEWHKVTFWGKLGDIVSKYLKKGSLVFIEGKITTSKYEKDGQTHYSTEIRAREMTMLGSKPNTNGSTTPSQNNAAPAAAAEMPASDPFNDDVPF